MEIDKDSCAGVILAGGLSTRLDGKNKALIEIGGRSILSRIYEVFVSIFDEIIIVTNDPLLYTDYDATLVTDFYPVRSSLTGIHAGLKAAARPFSFITACDVPFLQKKVVETLLERTSPPFDIIIPETKGGLEPLCAVYSKNCLNAITHRIERNQFKIKKMYRKMRMRVVSEKALKQSDPEMVSFININAPDDLKKATALALQLSSHKKETPDGSQSHA